MAAAHLEVHDCHSIHVQMGWEGWHNLRCAIRLLDFAVETGLRHQVERLAADSGEAGSLELIVDTIGIGLA